MKDGLKIIDAALFSKAPNFAKELEKELAACDVAENIYNLRTEAGLTQAKLAERIGTSRTIITRLEDADYNGHSLLMLRKIAAALGRRVEIIFPQ